jgi:hypothetical protein
MVMHIITILQEEVNWIKIDVEGAELEVMHFTFCLLYSNKSYHEFHQIISNNTHLYDKFEKWLKEKIPSDERNKLEKNVLGMPS